ncbi:MAG: PspC domain-containing protein, partial [Cellulomonadaceae bacterium]|nr:PspC domain-containing protein [Cellulomonadaceae bacterium]
MSTEQQVPVSPAGNDSLRDGTMHDAPQAQSTPTSATATPGAAPFGAAQPTAAPSGTVPPVAPPQAAGDGFFNSIRRSNIYRTEERWVGGVAGGIAQRLGWDPMLVRGI